MRILITPILITLVLMFFPSCSENRVVKDDPVTEKDGSGTAFVPTNLPVVVASPQFILETDIGPELASEGLLEPGSKKDPAREMAGQLLVRLDTFYRTLYTEGFGLASDRMKRGMVLEQQKKSVVASREGIESVRPHPVKQMRVALFTDEKDYRKYAEKARLLEYYDDAALDPDRLRLATFLHGTEEGTLDALFRLVCHGFVMQLAPDFPPWLEFGLAAYLTQLDRRRGIYLVSGKDPGRLERLESFLREGGKLDLRGLLTDRSEKHAFDEEKKLRAYGFVYWMQSGKTRPRALYSYVNELRYNEDKRQALAMWQEMPEEEREKIKRPDPEPVSAIQARFFSRLRDDLEGAEKYCARYILTRSQPDSSPPSGKSP